MTFVIFAKFDLSEVFLKSCSCVRGYLSECSYTMTDGLLISDNTGLTHDCDIEPVVVK